MTGTQHTLVWLAIMGSMSDFVDKWPRARLEPMPAFPMMLGLLLTALLMYGTAWSTLKVVALVGRVLEELR